MLTLVEKGPGMEPEQMWTSDTISIAMQKLRRSELVQRQWAQMYTADQAAHEHQQTRTHGQHEKSLLRFNGR